MIGRFSVRHAVRGLLGGTAIAAAMGTSPAIAGERAGPTISNQLLIDVGKSWVQMLAKASDEQASQYAAHLAQTMASLVGSPDPCVKVLRPSVFGPLRVDEWPKADLDRQMSLQRQIAGTALTSPNAVPTEAQAGPVLDRLLDKLTAQYGAEAVEVLGRGDKDIPRAHACLMWSRLYKEASLLPPAEGGKLVRWLNVP